MRVAKNEGMIIISEAKNRITIEKIIENLVTARISYKLYTTPTIRLPHLTFFYYLVNKYEDNNLVKTMIDHEMSTKNITKIQAAFKLSGYSLGSIYTLVLQKTND